MSSQAGQAGAQAEQAERVTEAGAGAQQGQAEAGAGTERGAEREAGQAGVASTPAQPPAQLPAQPTQPGFTCEVCGATFGSERSVEGHKLASHKIRPSWSGGAGKGEKTREAEQEGFPDLHKKLVRILEDCHVRNVQAVANLTQAYGYSQGALYQALKEGGEAVNSMRLAVRAWAFELDQAVDQQIQRALAMGASLPGTDWYGYGQATTTGQPSQTSPLTDMANALAALMKVVNPQPTPNPADAGVAARELRAKDEKIGQLEERLEQAREKAVETRIKGLEEKIEQAKASSKSDKESEISAIHHLGDRLERLIVQLYSPILAHNRVRGVEEAPARESCGAPGEGVTAMLLEAAKRDGLLASESLVRFEGPGGDQRIQELQEQWNQDPRYVEARRRRVEAEKGKDKEDKEDKGKVVA